MEKGFIDELYHQLRELYLTDDIQQKEAISGLVSHLANPRSTVGDYTGLLRFLTWYGEKFVLVRVYADMINCGIKPKRIIDLGAGFGWLGRGLSQMYGDIPFITVDKRQWPLIDVVADIETTEGTRRVLDLLQDGDVLVMGELLHCLDHRAMVLHPFAKWPIVAIEYRPHGAQNPREAAYDLSYSKQISRVGCRPVTDLPAIFDGRKFRELTCFPYTVIVVEPSKV